VLLRRDGVGDCGRLVGHDFSLAAGDRPPAERVGSLDVTGIAPIPLLRLDPGIPVPTRAHPGDAGVDLCTTEDVVLEPGERALVGTGIAVALPHGTVGLIHPRSGLAAKTGLSIVNTPGTVDAGYRGEIKVCLINHDPRTPIELRRGDRVAQLLVQRVELPDFVAVDSLDETARGAGGYGSSGGHASLETGPVGVGPVGEEA
jgi:dUTP pyrophosphatase